MPPESPVSQALNSGIPVDCANANTITNGALYDYPGIFGTGFFARIDRNIWYFTALHCVRVGPANPKPVLAELLIPIRHTGHSTSGEDFVEFGDRHTLELHLDGRWHDSIDLIAFEVKQPRRPRDFRHLLSRSAKIPASPKWLDDFLASSQGRIAIAAGNLAAVIIGFPRSAANSRIEYGEAGAETVINTEAVVIPALVGLSSLPNCLSVVPVDCPYEFSGLSGSPVFTKVEWQTGPQYALIGMVLSGSTTQLNALRLGTLLDAVSGDA